MSRDIIDELALIAHPHPRHGEVDPPEAFDDAAEQAIELRREYAENLRAMCDATDEDPLLAELRALAAGRERAELHVRKLLAFGRHCTGGTRPGYSWPVLAEAAGLDRKTAERRVSDADIDAVRAVVATPTRDQQTTPVTRSDSRTVTFDLLAERDLHFVLTDALQAWASRQREQAAHDETTAELRTRWAAIAEDAAHRVDATLETTP